MEKNQLIKEIDKLTSHVHEKLKKEEHLGEADLILLFIERLFYLDWASKGNSKGGFDLRFKRERFTEGVKRILVLQPSSIGDCVYTTPLLRGLKETYPDAKITYLVEKTAFGVVDGNPNLDRTLLLPRERWVRNFVKEGFKDTLKKITSFIKRLQALEFDLVVNLHSAPRCAFLSYLIKGKNTIGLTVDELARPFLVGSVWAVHKYYIIQNELMQDLRRLSLPELYIKIGGTNPKVREEVFPVPKRILQKTKERLSSFGVEEEDLVVGIVPGGNFPARRWPKTRYKELAIRLIENWNAKILLFGGKEDRELGEELSSVTQGKVLNLCGKTTLKELGAFLLRCDHVITNDTGPMHIAGALSKKSIILAGPTRTGPYGGDGHLLLQADLPCVGCGPTSSCTKGDCMKAITVEMVLDAFKYQRGELHKPPRFCGVNLYTSGKASPKRLFSYAPIRKRKGDASLDLLSLCLIDLWINENNKLGFFEEPLTSQEIEDEVKRHWVNEAILKGKKTLLDYLSEWKKTLSEGIHYLEKIRDGNTSSIEAYNELNQSFNRSLGGRALSFFEILYPSSHFKDPLTRALSLYRLKLSSCKRIEELLLPICE